MTAKMLLETRSEHLDPAAIQWGEPPAKSRGPGATPNVKLNDFVELLKRHPDRWAKYPDFVTAGYATALKTRYPGTEWTTRHPGEDEEIPAGKTRTKIVHLWGRFASNGDS